MLCVEKLNAAPMNVALLVKRVETENYIRNMLSSEKNIHNLKLENNAIENFTDLGVTSAIK